MDRNIDASFNSSSINAQAANLGDRFLEDQPQELKVALFTTNLKLGHEMSKALRNCGVFAYYYRDFHELWDYLDNESPDLLVCDLVSYYHEDQCLGEHPKFLAGKVPLGFYLNRRTQHFVTTAYKIANIGFIHHDISLTHQIANMVAVAKTLKQQRHEAHVEKKRMNEYRKLFSQQQHKLAEAEENFSKLKKTAEIIKDFQKTNFVDKDDFIKCFAKFLDGWKIVENYSFYTLNHSGQKLICPELRSLKAMKTPPLWLGKNCETGIEVFAQEMALQVIFDSMGLETLLLRVCGAFDHPEVLVFLKIRPDAMIRSQSQFQWGLMETLLSNVYRQSLLKNYSSEEPTLQQFIGTWDAFALLDDAASPERDSGYRFVNINLSTFNRFIALRSQEFRWRGFFSDFLLELSKKMLGDVKITNFGSLHIMCLLPEGSFSKNFDVIKKFVKSFEYWNYFVGDAPVFAALDYPSVTLCHPGSQQYLKKWFFSGAHRLQSGIDQKHSKMLPHEKSL